MSYSLLRMRRKVAVKPHSCTWCGMAIPKGATYVRECSTYDGSWQDFAWHEACRASSYAHFRWQEEFCPGEEEQPFPNLMMVDAVLSALEVSA